MTEFEPTQSNMLNVDKDNTWNLGGEYVVVGEQCIDEVVAE